MKTLLSIVLAVLALCSTGLAQKGVIRPPHPLRVSNGTGDGSYPFGHVQEISAPETLNGSNFFMWITIQGGYSIANPRSRTTTVRTLGHPMAVAAIYANAKVWYPDADEPPENQTELSVGLFLPKKPVPKPSAMIFLPKKPGPERRQMMLKATLEMGELGMGHENRIFEHLGFGLDWFPQQEGIWHSDDVEFYDSPSGRTRLTRGQHLSLSGSNIPYITEPTPIYASRTDSPTSKSRISSTVSRNLSVWYEPKWTTSDMAPRTPGETPREAPKMYVSTPLESVFGNTETWPSYSTVKSVPSVLLPVELISDLNNDGQISAADNPLRDAAMAGGATDEIKDKGTEFIFQNDTLSNGIWDKEDTDPARPATAKDDDDAEEITIKPGITEGEVWLDHPAIAKLSFYKTRECNAADKVNLSPTSKFSVSASNPFPDKLFMRADVDGAPTYPEADPQFAGDLVLKIKVGTNGQEIEAVKMKLTVVKQLGAKKFFHAARDYMWERNRGKFIHDWGYPVAFPAMHIRMCCMLEETADMQTIEASHKIPQFKGVAEIMFSRPYLDVLINGNLVFFSNALYNNGASQLAGLTQNKMTDLCNGRIVETGISSLASRDETPVISGLNPNLAGTNARYVSQSSSGSFTFSQGRVPVGPGLENAIGGLHTDYSSSDASGFFSWPIQMIGKGVATETGKGVIFTATGRSPADKGKGPEFKAAAEQSGVPPAPGGRIELFFLDYGETSPALAHSNPDGLLKLIWKGTKHDGNRYFVNTYVGFIAKKPR